MLEKIKPILDYAEWLALVVFCAIFGWTIHSRTLIGAMICYLLSALLIWIIFKLRSKKLSSPDIDWTPIRNHHLCQPEKYDTKYSYKKKRGYFPGIATIGPLIEPPDMNRSQMKYQR